MWCQCKYCSVAGSLGVLALLLHQLCSHAVPDATSLTGVVDVSLHCQRCCGMYMTYTHCVFWTALASLQWTACICIQVTIALSRDQSPPKHTVVQWHPLPKAASQDPPLPPQVFAAGMNVSSRLVSESGQTMFRKAGSSSSSSLAAQSIAL